MVIGENFKYQSMPEASQQFQSFRDRLQIAKQFDKGRDLK